MSDADNTARKHSGLVPFQPGQSGNPKGRPKGARNKLGEAFLNALHDDFAEHGAAAIQKTREEKPEVYVRIVASLLPQQIDVDATVEVTDARAKLARILAGQIGADDTGDGAGKPH